MGATVDRSAGGTGTGALTIHELTEAIGCYVWLSRHLAALLDGWRAGETDPTLAVYLHTLARRLDDHGATWQALLADSPALDAARSVRPPSEGWDELFGAESPGTSGRLVTLVHVVLPLLLTSLEDFARSLGPVAEAAEGRHCDIVTDDLRSQRNRGGTLLDERVAAPTQRRLAAVLRRRFANLSC